jgi:hypothetical protein
MEGQAPFDWWSLLHLAAGALFGLLGVPWHGLLALAVGYEGFEAGLREGRTRKGGIFAPESWKNMVCDVLVAGAGWGAAAWVLHALHA